MQNPNYLRLLYEWKKNPTSSAYHNIFVYQISGELKTDCLIQAIEQLPLCFPELQAYIDLQNDQPTKKMAPIQKDVVKFVDESANHLSLASINKIMDDFLHQPIAINQPPLYRYMLTKVKDNLHLLGICWFHLIDDAVSVTLLTKKISEIYNILSANKSFKPIIDCYPDDFDYEYANDGLQYWQTKCHKINAGGNSQLPQQYRSDAPNNRSKRVYFSLTESLSKSLLTYSAKNHCTLFVTLSAAFMGLCHLYSNDTNVTLSYSVCTRKRKDLLAVGFHVNNIPFHINLSSEMTFNELLHHVKKQREEDLPFQNVPIIEIAKLIDSKQKNSSLNYLINQFTNISFPITLNGLVTEPIPVVDNEAKNDFTIFYDYANNKINLEFEYRIALFSHDFIEDFKDAFIVFLAEMIQSDMQHLNKIPLLSKQNYQKIVHDWNSHNDLPYHASVPELFHLQVQKTPQHTAIQYHARKLTYQEVAHLSDHIAAVLLEKNIRKGTIVALFNHRSVESILAILAIFKIGAIYLPIDPNYPQNRIDYIINDAKPTLILTEEKIIELLNDKTIVLKNCYPFPEVAEPCYLFYTSGTTGRPKGVLNHGKGMLNRLLWMKEYCSINEQDVILQKTSLSFDISLWEMFVPLITGATLAIADIDSQKDPSKLLQHINEYKVTVIHFVPAMLNAFLPFVYSLNTMRLVICSGEALNFQTVKRFYEKLPTSKLLNLYGPTETSIDVTVWDTEASLQTGVVPIGYALPNVKLYILDENMQPVPIGKSGELYIGGTVVSYGYFNNPTLSAERFLDNPFTDDNSKIYKTGDVCRWINNKCVEYLGRNDKQIKFNGFRIEIGEIEYHLLSHKDVINCAVIFQNTHERQILHAFIVKKTTLDEESLKQFLKSRLPIYMLPNKYIFVDSIPNNAQGKVDAEALLNIKVDDITNTNQSTKIENGSIVSERLKEIWAEVLECTPEQLHENSHFIALGGDSISVLRVISLIEKEYNREVPISGLLEYPRLADFEKWLLNYTDAVTTPTKNIIPFCIMKRKQLSQMQKRLLLSNNNNIVFPFAWTGCLNKDSIKFAFKQLLQRHPLLCVNFKNDDNQWIYFESNKNEISFVDINHDDLATTALNAQKQLQISLRNIEHDSLFSIYVYSGLDQHIILFYFNHLIVDFASIKLILKEFFQLYQAAKLTANDLTEAVAYDHFVADEMAFLQSDRYIHQQNFWLAQYQRQKINTQLSNQLDISHAAALLQFSFQHETNAAINKLISHYQKTPFCILITVFMKVLQRFLQDPHFAIGFTISKRHHIKYSATVGPIINYALLFTPKADLSLSDSFNLVEKDIIHAYDHSDIEMDTILESVNAGKTFDIFFDYEGTSEDNFNMPGVNVTALPIIHADTMRRFISARVFKKRNDEYEIEIRYRKDLFKPQEITDLVNLYQSTIREGIYGQSNH